MTNAENMRNELMNILEELRPDIDFNTENKLITDGVLDSFDIISLIEEMNDVFDVDIRPSQITRENLDSIDAMISMINKLL